jgi:SAM-dependent methyltransferase
LLPLVCCPEDGLGLRASSVEPFVSAGVVTCAGCRRDYSIEDGILSLLGNELHPESDKEMRTRDVRNEEIRSRARSEWSSAHADAVEVRPTLTALNVEAGTVVAELGCGTGRYTVDIASRASATVAVDLSRSGLLVLRQKLDSSAPVALIQADVTRPYGSPQRFDRVLSTLHSNLPTREHRAAALQHAASVLKASGKAVISMHHRNLPDTVRGIDASGRYPDSGIYRYYMTKREARLETARFFQRLRFVYLSADLPRVPVAAVSLIAARMPLVRDGLARLFLAVGEAPRREEPAPGLRLGGAEPVMSVLTSRSGEGAV